MPDLRTNPDYIEAVINAFLQNELTEQQRDELLKPL
jgi:hypothetical protein